MLADTLIMKNGQQLQGKLVGQDRKIVRFKTDQGLKVLKKSDIKQIRLSTAAEDQAAEQKRRAAEARRRAAEREKARLAKEKAEAERKARELAEQERLAREKAEAEAAEKKRLAEEAQQLKEEAERKQAEEASRIAEEKRLAEEQARKAAEAKQLAAEKARQARGGPWYVLLGLASGDYESDLEERLASDWLGGSLVLNGYGFSTEWQNTSFNELQTGAGFKTERWDFRLELEKSRSTPAWQRTNQITTSINGTIIFLNSLQLYSLEPLERTNSKLSATYLLWDGGDHRIHVGLGTRQMQIDATYDLLHLSSFTTSLATSGSVISISPESFSHGDGSGLFLSTEYEYQINKKHQLSLGLNVYSLNGEWQLQRTLINAGTSSTELEYSSESGQYAIEGYELTLGYTYQLRPDMDLYVKFFQQQSTITDSQIIALSFDSGQGFSSTSLLALLLSYSGDAYADRYGGLRMGIQYRL